MAARKRGNGQGRESRFRALVQAEQEVSLAAEGVSVLQVGGPLPVHGRHALCASQFSLILS
jgi:hypothetical protein